jgi:manganese transport protein
MDQRCIDMALGQGGTNARYLLIHITESPVARYYGAPGGDQESITDAQNLQGYVDYLRRLDYDAESVIGYGDPVSAIAKIVNESKCDLLVMGAHGHRGLQDILRGATVDAVRHRVKVPVLIVR